MINRKGRFTGGSNSSFIGKAIVVFLIMAFVAKVIADDGLAEFEAGNYENALAIWNQQLAEKPNSAELNYNVAMLFDKGLGVDVDQTKAFEYYQKSADQKYAPAMFKLGTILIRQESNKEAAKWWLKASNFNMPEAQYNLARLYEDGVGVEKDLYKAKYWFKKAAQSAIKKFDSLNMDLSLEN